MVLTVYLAFDATHPESVELDDTDIDCLSETDAFLSSATNHRVIVLYDPKTIASENHLLLQLLPFCRQLDIFGDVYLVLKDSDEQLKDYSLEQFEIDTGHRAIADKESSIDLGTTSNRA